jgi:hypothetical protein
MPRFEVVAGDEPLAQNKALLTRIAELEAKHGKPPKTPDNSSLPPSRGRVMKTSSEGPAPARLELPRLVVEALDRPHFLVAAELCVLHGRFQHAVIDLDRHRMAGGPCRHGRAKNARNRRSGRASSSSGPGHREGLSVSSRAESILARRPPAERCLQLKIVAPRPEALYHGTRPSSSCRDPARFGQVQFGQVQRRLPAPAPGSGEAASPALPRT